MAQIRQAEVSVWTPAWVRPAGMVCLVAGILGAASGVFLALYPAQVPDERYSYPLTAAGFVALQVWFCVHHLGLLAGVAALGPSGALGPGPTGRWGARLAVAGMGLLSLTELLAVTARDRDLGDGTATLDTLYSISSLLIGVGLIAAGIAVRRAGVWRGRPSLVVLAAGVWVFVPMVPALFGPYVLARLAITGWMLLFVGLGYALWRPEARRQ